MQRPIPIVLRQSVLAGVAFLVTGIAAQPTAFSFDGLANVAAGVQQIVAHRGASSERPECTLVALQRAIDAGATAVEIDVRTSKDGRLFLLHDASLDRTTDGTGLASERTLAELKQLDAGSWFAAEYRHQRIATLREAVLLCRGKIDVLLDLKEQGETYAKSVAREVRQHGDPKRTIVGVRSVEQANLFRQLLPDSRQLGLIANADQIAAFAEAGTETIRLWPHWLADESLVPRIRQLGVRLHLNGATGSPAEILPLLAHKPASLLVDDPAALVATLAVLKRSGDRFSKLADLAVSKSNTTLLPWISRPGAMTFLNRDYKMLELPDELLDQPRFLFDGGSGDRVVLKFKEPTVVFAAFEYNDTGRWSFPGDRSPEDCGWRLLRSEAYSGTSNVNLGTTPHQAAVHYCQFDADELLSGLPPWWVCLAVADLKTAAKVHGFRSGTSGPIDVAPAFSYQQWATRQRPLAVPEFQSREQWSAWQSDQRQKFQQRLVFPYDAKPTVIAVGDARDRAKFWQQELEVHSDGQKLFRFFRLTPKTGPAKTGSAKTGPLNTAPVKRRATIVCFMGHGKVRQILEDRESYQHACAAQFAERGYLVFAMENVGMGPAHDTHHELDRLLRLDGYCWYSLLIAHQQILLDHVFSDERVDAERVGVTGVSTGGLLALSAVAFEPRVAAASVHGIFGSMRVSFVRDRDRHCRCGAIPGLLPEFDLPEMALLVAPRPIHFSNATADGFGPAEAKRCVQQITPLYQLSGGGAPQFRQPPGAHEFAFKHALEFFQGTIGPADD